MNETTISDLLGVLNGMAGVAALVNSLLMWPTIRYLKRLEPRVEALELATAKAKADSKKRARKRSRL
jgi:hypothetical protein